MKAVYSTLLLAVVVAFSSSGTLAQTSQKDSPSYDDTVHYIQERLSLGLEQESRCHFIHHEDDGTFNAAELSPHVSWSGSRGSINCAGGARCVHNANGVRRGDWSFWIKEDTDKSKMEKALLHLLDLCGVRPAKPDLF
jgi:hypothetical protein